MPITAYLSIAKDAAIVGAIGFLIWFVYHSGANSVRVADIEAVQKQLAANAQTEERYHSEINDAFAEIHSQMGGVYASIDAQRKPLIVRIPASSGSLPSTPASPAGTAPEAGGVDIRPGVNSFERKYEQALAECRALRDAWPK